MDEEPDRDRPPLRDAARLASAARATAAAVAGWQLDLVAAAAVLALLLFIGLVVSATTGATIGGREVCSAPGGQGGRGEIPAGYLPWLTRAAARYRLGPRGFGILAAIQRVESDVGRSTLPGVRSGTNPAGAAGPGQFLASTWAVYGVDADGDGRRDPYSIPDSVFATANYLRASGAPANWRAAIFAYNHANWYVDEVLALAERYQGRLRCRLVGSPGPGGGSDTVALGRIDWTDTSGPWGGSEKFARLAAALGRRHGCSVVSAKRPTESTASGNVSDHWTGARHSYAVDLDACDLAYPGGAADLSARDVAAAFGLPAHTGVVSAIRGRYRVQLLWQTDVGGDHFNHVHVGVRNLCCLASG